MQKIDIMIDFEDWGRMIYSVDGAIMGREAGFSPMFQGDQQAEWPP